MKRLFLAATAALFASPLTAADVALVVGNEDYRQLPDLRGAGQVAETASAFRSEGYVTFTGRDLTRREIAELLDTYAPGHDVADRVVIVLSGHFFTVGDETYLLPTDTRIGSPGAVLTQGLPISALLGLLADHPGDALLMLGTQPIQPGQAAFMLPGVAELDVPQGVAVGIGQPSDVAVAVRTLLRSPGMTVQDMALRRSGVAYSGFTSSQLTLSLDDEVVAENGSSEDGFWQAAEALGSKRAFEVYLETYPQGRYAALAKQRLDEIAATTPKFTPQEQAERALSLTRADRRDVQRALDLLGFDPRGIDGVFGPATRSALTRWQGQAGLEPTGYLNARSLTLLSAAAERRADKLRAEAEAKKAEQDRQDAAFWGQTGARGSEADLLAYLKKYPDGLYSDVAKDQLEEYAYQNRLNAEAEERNMWDRARQVDSAAAYRNFLNAFPSGPFSKQARAALEAKQEDQATKAIREAAKREEARLKLPQALRLAVERRLQALNFDPGQPDGTFDKATRRAIRQYQRSRDLQVSGFITRQTAVRLLSE